MNSEQLEGAKKLFFILLGIDIAVTVIVGLNAFSTVAILQKVQSGARDIDQSMISSFEFWEGFSMLIFLTMIGVGLGLVKWLNACYGYAKQTIGAAGFKNEGWTALGWLIPIFNLFKPYQIINEIYKAGSNGYAAAEDWKKESGSGALLTWWIFWAVTHFIGWIMTKFLMRSALRDDITIPNAIGLTELQAWSCMISLVIAGLWFWVANLLTQRLLDRSAISANPVPLKYASQAPVAVPFATRPASTSAQPQSISAPIQTAMSTTQGTTQSKNSPSAPIFDEDAIYEIVANEIESGKTEKGLWTRLFAQCDGDENRTKVAYIKQRVEKLIAVERARIAELMRQRAEEDAKAEQARLMRLEDTAALRNSFISGHLLTSDEISALVRSAPEHNISVGSLVGKMKGQTLLHQCVQLGLVEEARILMGSGADPRVPDGNGRSAIDLAGETGNPELIALLSLS